MQNSPTESLAMCKHNAEHCDGLTDNIMVYSQSPESQTSIRRSLEKPNLASGLLNEQYHQNICCRR